MDPRADHRPTPMPLAILAEDEALIAIDKRPGLLVIPDRFDPSRPTLFNGVWHHLLERAGGSPADPRALERHKPRLVHRLDAGTSGVIVFAKTTAAQQALSRAFEQGTARKRYLALCDGVLASEMAIDLDIGPAPKQTRRTRGRMFVGPPGAKAARTVVRPREALPDFTLVEAEPQTGRTHQIRVHLAAVGHPLAVDPLYGDRDQLRAGGVVLERLALHAERLVVLGYDFTAPIAADLDATVAALRGP